MKTTPISYSRPMAVARIDGFKTKTRRVIKPPKGGNVIGWGGPAVAMIDMGVSDGCISVQTLTCHYGMPGDRLWVKEEHYLWGIWKVVGVRSNGKPKFRFVADQSKGSRFDVAPEGLLTGFNTEVSGWHKRIAMFMPRWASRGLDEIVSVRVERLQDISEEDCFAEGCAGGFGAIPGYGYAATAFEHYHWLWNSLNGKGAFEANPWVWVIEFKVLKGGAAC